MKGDFYYLRETKGADPNVGGEREANVCAAKYVNGTD